MLNEKVDISSKWVRADMVELCSPKTLPSFSTNWYLLGQQQPCCQIFNSCILCILRSGLRELIQRLRVIWKLFWSKMRTLSSEFETNARFETDHTVSDFLKSFESSQFVIWWPIYAICLKISWCCLREAGERQAMRRTNVHRRSHDRAISSQWSPQTQMMNRPSTQGRGGKKVKVLSSLWSSDNTQIKI